MQALHLNGTVRQGGRFCLVVLALALGGCSMKAQTQRYEDLIEEFDRAGKHALPPPSEGDLSIDTAAEMERGWLVRAVLDQNPSVEAARQAWRMTLARYPQAATLDDPRFGYGLAPASIATDDARFGQVLDISQRVPFPGKLALQGAVALAEAEAAREDYEALRQNLAMIASLLFDEFYLTDRSLEINTEHASLLRALKESAEIQYEAGRASLQDPLQAEVELAHLDHERILLESRRNIVIAQLNALLHRTQSVPLPPPPARLNPPVIPSMIDDESADEDALERPEIQASEARIRAAEATADLAHRQYYPDFGFSGRYNSMWATPEHRFMVGVSLNIPIRFRRREAAVEQARARLQNAMLDHDSRLDEARSEIEQSRLRLIEVLHVVSLHEERLLPSSRDQVAAARVGFTSGRNSFLTVIEAERSLRTIELQSEQAIASAHQRLAELERALGRMPVIDRQENMP